MALKGKGRVVVMLVLLCIIAAILFGLREWYKPRRSVADVQAIHMSSDSLLAQFSANEKLADSLYLNKAIEVTGKVQSVDTNADGKTTVLFESQDPMSSVFCTLRKKGEKVEVGSKTVIKGFCSGLTTDVILTDCILIQNGDKE
ncbi:MAG: hypothetical protein ABI378_13885 [Chitinophagaceae bacterium]